MRYFIGLDMGTSSLGWAVTDENYQILRRKGKDLWGVRLYDEANTAQERRTNRVAKRRRKREKARIGYLKEMFAEEINKIDPGFFQRLEDSRFYEDDKRIEQPFALFADKGFTDKEYYKQYPTIFHLRKKLLETTEPQDVRLVYLALLNMFKHRGHFLNANLSGDSIGEFQDLYSKFCDNVSEILGLEMPSDIQDGWLEQMLASSGYSKSKKAEEIWKHYGISKTKEKAKAEIWKLICGMKGTLSNIFFNITWEEENKKFSLSFEDGNYEENILKAESILDAESYDLLIEIKGIHDWAKLSEIMRGKDGTYEFLSFSRVDSYEKHKKDLQVLKCLYKNHAFSKYNQMFRIMRDHNYSAYVGSVNSDSTVLRRQCKCDTELFFKQIKKDLGEMPDTPEKKYVLDEIEKGSFLPKQLTSANGVIPNQIHKMEMKKILENAQEYLPFLCQKDESGLTVSERIIKLFEFQIPYYVGPISPVLEGKMPYSENVWSVRREPGKVFPWNFDEKIDVKASAENFIARMVNHCTYISGENVLPKNSLLYEKFMVLNELNNLKINGERVSTELKQKIFNELLKTEKRVSEAKLIAFLKAEGYVEPKETPEISGIDGGFKNSRANYVKFTKIFGTEVLSDTEWDMAEHIIFWSTVYGDTKKFLKEKIKEQYEECLTKSQVDRIVGYKFRDWGRLSKSLLETEGADKTTGEICTVMQRMWDESLNLMELIASNQYTYKEEIESKTQKLEKTLTEIEYEDLEELYISAPVRRMVWQTILVLKEIVQVMGEAPERIFVEMARGPETEKKRTISRKKKFEELYKKCKEEGRDWHREISETDEGKFRSKKLYLYYTQKGRCMYTGESIELKDLFNDNLYDIDHIYPRHFVKDDSIENNLVLVKKQVNAHKSDHFPLESDIRAKCGSLWKGLQVGGFISDEKYRRLTRTTAFTDDERAAFISRQLVETRQGTRIITNLFEQTFPDVEIVYVKAGNVTSFRHDNDLLKNRLINDFHHAQDAYLNIVVGNVYYVKFTKNPYNYIKEYNRAPEKNKYHMDKIFYYTVKRNEEVAWERGKSIGIVKKMMNKNTPLVTRKNYEQKGRFADQTIYSAKIAQKVEGKSYIPIKESDVRLSNVCRYGGFTNIRGAYFSLVEHTKKGKRIRTLEPVPVYKKEQLKTHEQLEEYFRTDENYKYINPKVLLCRVKMGSLIKVNGYYLYLTGRSGNQLSVNSAVQMILSKEQSDYVRILQKEEERQRLEETSDSHIVTRDENEELYEVLTDKYLHQIYKNRPNPIGEKLQEWKEKFGKLKTDRQVYVLLQILRLSTPMNQGADLRDLGGAKQTGVTMLNKEVTKQQEFKLINQSATGLYESELDLLKL